jgi:hypothetical protein
MVRSRTKAEKDRNKARASIGAGLRLSVGHASANAEDSRYDEIINSGVKNIITGTNTAKNPSRRKVDKGRMLRGCRRWIGLDG